MATKKKAVPPKAEPKEIKPEVAKERSIKDIFDGLGKWMPVVATGAVLLICYVVFQDYLLGEKIYYFKDISSDSSNFSYPVLYNIADYIARYGVPKWSFNVGMGQNIFPFFLRDPFDIFLFMAGKGSIAHGLIYLELLKIVLAGTCFFYYLKYLKLSNYTALIGTLMFSFCGFIIEGSGWYIFTFEALNLAVMLLAFERLFAGKSGYLFVFSVFGYCISMPFNLYVYGLFIALYALLRCAQEGRLNLKSTGNLFLKMIGFGLIGILLSGPFLLENVVQLLESPRVSGVNSLSHILMSRPLFGQPAEREFGTAIMRFFSNEILYSGGDFNGWKNILEAPMFYCSLPCLLLMPQVFPFLEKKIKVFFIVFLAAWLLPIFIPYLRYAFWLFSGDYYRAYSFFVSLIFIFYSLHALDMIIKKGKINLIILGCSIVGLLLLLKFPFFKNPDDVDHTIQGFVAIMIVVYGVIIFMLGKLKDIGYMKYAFLVLLIAELCYFSGITANHREYVTEAERIDKIGYNDYTNDAIRYLKKSDNSFFRVDKSYWSSLAHYGSLNDGQAQDYYGTSSYNPFNQLYYVEFLQLMGVSDKAQENDSRWSKGLASRPLIESQNRVKYMLAKSKVNPVWQFMCDSLTTLGDVKIYRNKFVLPFGHTYSRYFRESSFENLSPDQKSFMTLNACIVKDADIPKLSGLKEIQAKDTFTAFNFDIYRSWVNEMARDSLVVTKFSETLITGTTDLNEEKMMYLSIPYDAGWHCSVDGKPCEKLIADGGMTGILLSKGRHSVEMKYELRYFNKGLLMSALGLLAFAVPWYLGKRKNEVMQDRP